MSTMAIIIGTFRDLIYLDMMGCMKRVKRIYIVKQIRGTMASAGEVGIVFEDSN